MEKNGWKLFTVVVYIRSAVPVQILQRPPVLPYSVWNVCTASIYVETFSQARVVISGRLAHKREKIRQARQAGCSPHLRDDSIEPTVRGQESSPRQAVHRLQMSQSAVSSVSPSGCKLLNFFLE